MAKALEEQASASEGARDRLAFLQRQKFLFVNLDVPGTPSIKYAPFLTLPWPRLLSPSLGLPSSPSLGLASSHPPSDLPLGRYDFALPRPSLAFHSPSHDLPLTSHSAGTTSPFHGLLWPSIRPPMTSL